MMKVSEPKKRKAEETGENMQNEEPQDTRSSPDSLRGVKSGGDEIGGACGTHGGLGCLSRHSDWLRVGRSGDRIPVGGGRDFLYSSSPTWVPPSPLYNMYRVCRGGKAAGAWR